MIQRKTSVCAIAFFFLENYILVEKVATNAEINAKFTTSIN